MTHPDPQPLAPSPFRDQRGQSMVELVLGLPLLLLVLVAILQFGLVMHDYVEVTQAARAGARKASVSRKSDRTAAATAAVRQSATGLDEDELGIDFTPPGAGRKGDPVAVEVSYPYKIDLLGLVFQEGTMKFRATARTQ